MNTRTTHQLPEARHAAAMEAFIAKTIDDTPETDAYAKAINDRQWEIVAAGKYSMDDAFVLAVEEGGAP